MSPWLAFCHWWWRRRLAQAERWEGRYNAARAKLENPASKRCPSGVRR